MADKSFDPLYITSADHLQYSDEPQRNETMRLVEAIERHTRYADGVVSFPAYMWEQFKQSCGIAFEPTYLEEGPLALAQRVEALLRVTFPRTRFNVDPNCVGLKSQGIKIRYETGPRPHSQQVLMALTPIDGYRFVFENMD